MLAELARGRLRSEIPALRQALAGECRVERHGLLVDFPNCFLTWPMRRTDLYSFGRGLVIEDASCPDYRPTTAHGER